MSRHVTKLRNRAHQRKEWTKWYHENGAHMVVAVLAENPVDNVELNENEFSCFHHYSPLFYGQVPANMKKNYQQSEETRRKISESLKKRYKEMGLSASYTMKKCPHCGEEFTYPSRLNKIFCGSKCSRGSINVDSLGVQDGDRIVSMYQSGMSLRGHSESGREISHLGEECSAGKGCED